MKRIGAKSWTISVIVVLFFVITAAYWWANIPPVRPDEVPPTAVFLWGQSVGLPAQKRGSWLNCWFDSEQNVNRCRVTRLDGSLLHEGIFVPYGGQTSIPTRELEIDPTASRREAVWVEGKFVPVVYLRNGSILIPKESYQAGKKRLDELRKEREK